MRPAIIHLLNLWSQRPGDYIDYADPEHLSFVTSILKAVHGAVSDLRDLPDRPAIAHNQSVAIDDAHFGSRQPTDNKNSSGGIVGASLTTQPAPEPSPFARLAPAVQTKPDSAPSPARPVGSSTGNQIPQAGQELLTGGPRSIDAMGGRIPGSVSTPASVVSIAPEIRAKAATQTASSQSKVSTPPRGRGRPRKAAPLVPTDDNGKILTPAVSSN